jgi:hypothetical protein
MFQRAIVEISDPELTTEKFDTILYYAITAIRDDNIDMLKLILEGFPKITKEDKEELLSVSVNSNSQGCFNYLYGSGVKSFELMQYTSNYKNFLKMKNIYISLGERSSPHTPLVGLRSSIPPPL